MKKRNKKLNQSDPVESHKFFYFPLSEKYHEIPLIIHQKNNMEPQYAEVFIGGCWDDGLGIVYESLYKKSNCDVKAYFHWNSHYIERNLIRFRKKYPKTTLILVGHSYGGSRAFQVINKLPQTAGKNILITIDPVSQFDIIHRKKRHNIHQWINAYIKKGVGDAMTNVPIFTMLWGLTIGVAETTFSEKTLSDVVASTGGRWGKQKSADYNIPIESKYANHVSIVNVVNQQIGPNCPLRNILLSH